jgi:hypothetical protein
MVLRSIKNKREIDQATTTNPDSRGGLLPFDHGVDEEDVAEGGDPSGGGSDGVPPQIFAPTASVLLFLCLYGALLERTLGECIVVFGPKEVRGRKIEAKTVEGEKRSGAPLLGTPHRLFWASKPSR